MTTTIANAVFDATPIANAVVAIVAGLDAKSTLVAGFADLTFEAFEGRAKMVRTLLVSSGMSANEESAVRMMQRAFVACGIEKPKSTSAEAVKKAAQRKAAHDKAEKAAKQIIANAKKEAGKDATPEQVREKIASKVVTGDKAALAAVKLLNDQAHEKVKAENSAMLKAIRAELNSADKATLQAIANLLKIKP